MKLHHRSLRFAAAALLLGMLAAPITSAQETERLFVVPLSDPGKPARLKVHLTDGSIMVEATDRRDIEVSLVSPPQKLKPRKSKNGMMRIPKTGVGLSAEERDNLVELHAMRNIKARLLIQVPRRTSVVAGVVNGGDLTLIGATGEHELNNVNGSIRAESIRGSVLAQTTNGSVIVSFERLDPDSPMSFASWNGKVDVTLPANVGADLKLETSGGEIYTDFEVALDTTPQMEQGRGRDGRYRVELNSAVRGRIGGGGPELTLKSYNGNLYVRRGN